MSESRETSPHLYRHGGSNNRKSMVHLKNHIITSFCIAIEHGRQ